MAINASICDRDLRQLSQVNTPRKVQKIIMPVKILLRHSPMPLKIMPQHGPRKVQKIMPVTPSLPPLPPPRPSASENFAPAWPQNSKENYAREVSASFLPLGNHCFQLLRFRFRSSSHRCHCVHVAQLNPRASSPLEPNGLSTFTSSSWRSAVRHATCGSATPITTAMASVCCLGAALTNNRRTTF